MDAIIIAIVTGAVSGGVSWGMVRMELRWLRADVDRAHDRIAEIERRLAAP